MRGLDIEFIRKYPHVMCFILSGVLLLVSLINFHSASLSGDYIPTTGEITNVKKDSKYVHGTRRYEYDFDVSWEMDGQTYEKHFEDQLEYRPEGLVDVWVSPDNQKMRFSSSEEVYKELPLSIAGGVVAGVLGFILLKRKNKKRKYISKAERIDQLESRKIGSVLAFFCFVLFGGFFGYDIYKEYQETFTYNAMYVDMVMVSIVGMLVCVGLFIHAHVKLKQ